MLQSQNLPILEMIDKQNELIDEFIGLGFTKENFYEVSRHAVGIDDDCHVIDSKRLQDSLNKINGI